MTDQSSRAATYGADLIERCAQAIEPQGPRPCDCTTCDCGNSGDARAVAWWDEAKANADKIRALKSSVSETAGTFQGRVAPWMEACFGSKIAADVVERNHRFLEEALELVQSKGCTADEAHRLVDYVFGRPLGEPHQEVGGVMVTLAALCLASGLDMHAAAEDELRRVWGKIDVIREKQRNKPKNSPLPEATALSAGVEPIGYAVRMADGPFVGIWQERATADHVCSKQPAAHGDYVLPVYALPSATAATSLDQVNELLAILNGDGGHRRAAVGQQQAAKEAIEKVLRMMQLLAENDHV